MADTDTALSRTESILMDGLGEDPIPPVQPPLSRIEALLQQLIAEGGGGTVTIDQAIDALSPNPVRNSAIAQALSAKVNASDFEDMVSELFPVMTKEEYDALTPSQKTALFYMIREDSE